MVELYYIKPKKFTTGVKRFVSRSLGGDLIIVIYMSLCNSFLRNMFTELNFAVDFLVIFWPLLYFLTRHKNGWIYFQEDGLYEITNFQLRINTFYMIQSWNLANFMHNWFIWCLKNRHLKKLGKKTNLYIKRN